jgi:hypothetical protein
MWLTMMVAVILFAGMFAALYFGYQETEKERTEKAAADAAREPPPLNPWLRPQNPWLRGRTVDEVVFEVEHRIDADLQEVSLLLGRAAPENASRLYRA